MTGHELSTGIKILVQVNVEFHELYGLSLNISDIDPKYTIGDLAQKRTEILKKLEDEGIINMNKELAFPVVPQKIAIISSDTAAGYQDFLNQLENNSFGFKFYTKLFPSIMQGLQAEESIINSLERIYNYEDFFDLVVIIRGGGSQADLSCFNNYMLAANVAQFPLPVLTGIGHDKDESIVDIVAHKKLKTPTAVAEFIIDTVDRFENNLINLKDNILNLITDYTQDQKTKLAQFAAVTVPSVKNNLYKYDYQLNKIKNQLIHQCNIYTQKQNLFLKNLENKTSLLDPSNILKRGYSITYFNNKKLKDLKNIKENDEIITKLFTGFIRSTVKEKFKKGN